MKRSPGASVSTSAHHILEWRESPQFWACERCGAVADSRGELAGKRCHGFSLLNFIASEA